MVRVHCFIVVVVVSSCLAIPTNPEPTIAEPDVNNVVEDLRVQCSNNDGIACIKFKFLNLLDQALKKDTIQVTENVFVEKNTDVAVENSADVEKVGDSAEGRGFLDHIDEYFKSHDIIFHLPQILGGSRIAVSPRNLDNNEIALKLKLQDETSQVEGKGRKNRLRRLLVPLIVFVLLKAMTLVPLAVGVLGLKAWNALQLSFFSFVISISLAIFQLCKKIAADSAVMPTAAHTSGPWEAYSQYAAARNFFEQAAAASDTTNDEPQVLAYNSHVPH